jgi:hypothetical protein
MEQETVVGFEWDGHLYPGGTVRGIFREIATAFVRSARQPSVEQMQSLYDKLSAILPRSLKDADATALRTQERFRILWFSSQGLRNRWRSYVSVVSSDSSFPR